MDSDEETEDAEGAASTEQAAESMHTARKLEGIVTKPHNSLLTLFRKPYKMMLRSFQSMVYCPLNSSFLSTAPVQN